jgi:hypothetical protein
MSWGVRPFRIATAEAELDERTRTGSGYSVVHGTRPQTIGYSNTDSPAEVPRPSRRWAERGGHFGGWEQPNLLVADLRAAARLMP